MLSNQTIRLPNRIAVACVRALVERHKRPYCSQATVSVTRIQSTYSREGVKTQRCPKSAQWSNVRNDRTAQDIAWVRCRSAAYGVLHSRPIPCTCSGNSLSRTETMYPGLWCRLLDRESVHASLQRSEEPRPLRSPSSATPERQFVQSCGMLATAAIVHMGYLDESRFVVSSMTTGAELSADARAVGALLWCRMQYVHPVRANC
ncbi:hypothetical protein C8Q73DRAFT_214541 [Cubamyces lactineus]|nr:hypothetical protein C8Q73DRAFT_214541 [Cubamyces lactineus]